jgi:hypothetical protein
MALRRCRKCDLPLRLSRGYEWPGNGTIFAKHDPAMRMVIFEADYYTYVWSELERMLGVSVADAMIRGQHASTWDYLENNVLYGWRKYVIHRLPIDMVYKRIIDEMAVFGFGKLEVIEYQRGKLVVIKATRPFDAISLSWGIKGFVEFVEDKDSELAWIEDGDECMISVAFKPGGGYREGIDPEARQILKDAKRELSMAGNLLPPRGEKLSSCPACGIPDTLAELEWKEEDGAIYTRGGDRRYMFSSGHIFIGVVRDLEKKTGRDLDPIVEEITKNYHLRNMQGVSLPPRGHAYNIMARYLTVGGYGEVINMSYGEGHLEIAIGNPFHTPRLVGRIAGFFEYIEGQEADIIHKSPEPRILEIQIKTA